MGPMRKMLGLESMADHSRGGPTSAQPSAAGARDRRGVPAVPCHQGDEVVERRRNDAAGRGDRKMSEPDRRGRRAA